jgi:hypothetical protein
MAYRRQNIPQSPPRRNSQKKKLTVAQKLSNLKKKFPIRPKAQVATLPIPQHIQNVYFEEKDVMFVPEETTTPPPSYPSLTDAYPMTLEITSPEPTIL